MPVELHVNGGGVLCPARCAVDEVCSMLPAHLQHQGETAVVNISMTEVLTGSLGSRITHLII